MAEHAAWLTLEQLAEAVATASATGTDAGPTTKVAMLFDGEIAPVTRAAVAHVRPDSQSQSQPQSRPEIWFIIDAPFD